MFVRNSNGLASGNDVQEALLHGLCEVVERHAWYLAQVQPERLVALDPDTLDSPALEELVDAVRAVGWKLGLYDITWEAGLPTAFAKLVAPDLPVVWHGSGCHPSPEVALSRALTEAAQSRLTYIAGARDDLVALASGARFERSFETFVEPPEARTLAEVEDVSTERVDDDVERTVARLAALDLEAFWIDLTHPELGIPVVSTFVPGLKEMHG